jgi:hypothetical protein
MQLFTAVIISTVVLFFSGMILNKRFKGSFNFKFLKGFSISIETKSKLKGIE